MKPGTYFAIAGLLLSDVFSHDPQAVAIGEWFAAVGASISAGGGEAPPIQIGGSGPGSITLGPVPIAVK